MTLPFEALSWLWRTFIQTCGDVIKIKHILTEKLECLVIEGEAKRPDLGLDWGPPPPTMDGPFLEDLKFLFGEARVQDLQQDDCWEYDETQV